MFSLIITIISIALVAGLALATMFFGGESFLNGQTEADAARYINESQQIAGAIRMYQADQMGSLPGDLDVLVDESYLKNIPASGADWNIGEGAIVKEVGSSETCENVNKKAGWENPNFGTDPEVTSEHYPASCDDPSLDGETYYCCINPTTPVVS